jgi:hypothetical protein
MWPFKNKTSRHKSFPIGIYELNVSTNNLKDLVEFSDSEYASIPRKFVNGKNYNAPPINFLNRQWSMQIGAVSDKIYKIHPYLLVNNKDKANLLANETIHFCIKEIGQPSEQKGGFIIWDTSDGNVIIQTDELSEGWLVSLFITSSEVRNIKILS